MTFSWNRRHMLVLLAGLAACRRRDDASKQPVAGQLGLRIAVLLDSRASPFRNTQALHLQKLAATRVGWIFQWWDAAGRADLQTAHAMQAAATKPDFMLVFPLDILALKPVLVEAKSAGIKVIVCSQDATEECATSAIFCDEGKIGRLAGEFVIKSLRQKAADEKREAISGRVVELTVSDSAARSAGFAAAIAMQAGVTLVHQAPCDEAGDDAAARIGEALRLQKTFDVLFAHNDLVGKRAADTVVAVGPALREPMLVVGVDGSLGKNGGVGMVVASEIDATIHRPVLIDLFWAMLGRSSADGGFKLRPRYEIEPLLVNYESALNFMRQGSPVPKLD